MGKKSLGERGSGLVRDLGARGEGCVGREGKMGYTDRFHHLHIMAGHTGYSFPYEALEENRNLR
jgi:hypothetical protein